MPLLDAAMLANLRKTQESSMHHVCEIEPYIVGDDGTISYGSPVETICGFDNRFGRYSRGLTGREVYETIPAEAAIRLPFGTAVGMKDRITLIKSFGEILETPRVFEVTGFPDTFGPSGFQVEVREIYN